MTTNPFRWIGIVLVCAALIGLFVGIPVWYLSGPSDTVTAQSPAPQPQGQAQAPADTRARCPGDGETKTIGPNTWVDINPGNRCHIIFEVVGTEMMLGKSDNYVKAKPGDSIGNVLKKQGVTVTSVKSTGGHGSINYVLHPHGCIERGWDCVSTQSGHTPPIQAPKQQAPRRTERSAASFCQKRYILGHIQLTRVQYLTFTLYYDSI